MTWNWLRSTAVDFALVAVNWLLIGALLVPLRALFPHVRLFLYAAGAPRSLLAIAFLHAVLIMSIRIPQWARRSEEPDPYLGKIRSVGDSHSVSYLWIARGILGDERSILRCGPAALQHPVGLAKAESEAGALPTAWRNAKCADCRRGRSRPASGVIRGGAS